MAICPLICCILNIQSKVTKSNDIRSNQMSSTQRLRGKECLQGWERVYCPCWTLQFLGDFFFHLKNKQMLKQLLLRPFFLALETNHNPFQRSTLWLQTHMQYIELPLFQCYKYYENEGTNKHLQRTQIIHNIMIVLNIYSSIKKN